MWKILPDVSKEELRELQVSKKVKLYADADIEEDAVEFLRDNGVNITSARELGYRGKPDEFQAAFSYKEKRFLLTKNGKHFLNDRLFPFHRLFGIIVVSGDMGDMWQYTRTLLSILAIIPYANSYTGMKIRIASNEFTLRFIDNSGHLTNNRLKIEGENVYVWEEE